MFATLKPIVERPESRGGRRFALSIQVLILISLATFSIETVPDLSPASQRVLRLVEIVTVAIFTGEYLLRLIVAERKLAFVFSFFGMVDLLAVLPFYLATGLDLRAIRIVRVLRVFRIFKLVRYSIAIQRFYRAYRIAREELTLFFILSALVIYLAAVGIYYFENEAQPEHFGSVFQSLWWALVTLTTVGYGDAFPITIGGRIFTAAILMIGLGIVALPAGIMASALTQARETPAPPGE